MSEILGRLGGPRDDDEGPAEQEPSAMVPGSRAGRWLRRHVAGGVAALTTVVDGSFRASSVTGLMVASIEPLLLLISLEADSQMESWVRSSGIFAVSVLGYQQQFLADQFAGLAPLASSRFEGIKHFVAETGAPILSHSIGWADCRVSEQMATGDHTAFVGRAVAVGRGEGHTNDPLVHYLSRYVRLR